jgi:hypothetical protein
MLYQSSFLSKMALLALTLPVFGFSAAIEANGTCEVGTCASPGSIPLHGNSFANFSFNVTASGDSFLVTGSYFNTFPSGGTGLFFFAPTVELLSGTAAATVSLDMLQDYYAVAPNNNWDSPPPYGETLQVVLGAGTTASAQAFYDGQSLSKIGPESASGTYTAPGTSLVGLNDGLNDGNATLLLDANVTFTFAANSAPGTIASAPTPEPAETMLLGAGFLGLILLKIRKFRATTAS